MSHHVLAAVAAVGLLALSVPRTIAAAPGGDSIIGSASDNLIFSSPQALDEAERTLSPPIQRVPLQEALQARPVERSDTPRVSPETLASHNRWQNRAFATFTIVALACLTVVAVAALITIGRRR